MHPADSATSRPGREPPSLRASRHRNLAFVILIGALAAAYVAFVTPSAGLLGGPDSSAYLGTAQNIADGRGITIPFAQPYAEVPPSKAASVFGAAPLAQYYPGFPLLLAIPVAAGASPEGAARVFNAIAGGVTIAALAAGVLVLTRGSWIAASIAAVLVSTTRSFATSFSALGTEALFVPLCLVALGLVALYLRRWARWAALVFVVVAGLASVTRFLGIALGATGGVAILLQHRVAFPTRLRRAALVGAGAMAPAFAWQAYKIASGGTGGAGTLAVHLPSGAVPGLVEVAGAWVNGRTRLFDVHTEMVDVPTAIVLVALGLVLVSTVVLVARPRSTSEASLARQLALVSVIFLVLYVAFLWVTVGFLVYATPFADERMLLPVLPIAVGLTVSGITHLIRAAPRNRPIVRASVVAGAILIAAPIALWHATGARTTIHFQRVEIARAPARSPATTALYRVVARLPPRALIFSNDPADIWHDTRRFTASLPLRISPWTGKTYADFEQRLAEVAPALCRDLGLVLFFPGPSRNNPTAQEFEQAHLTVIGRSDNIVTYGADPEACTTTSGAVGRERPGT